jgi:phage terminase small subunit
MEGSGRKSAAALALVTAMPGQRPEPPTVLSESEADIWRSVVATKPHDWFTPDTFPLLEEYCRQSVQADQLAVEQARFKGKIPTHKDKFARYKAIGKMRRETAGVLLSLATKMRLSQQSRYGARAASTAHDKAGSAGKPWEFGKGA